MVDHRGLVGIHGVHRHQYLDFTIQGYMAHKYDCVLVLTEYCDMGR